MYVHAHTHNFSALEYIYFKRDKIMHAYSIHYTVHEICTAY